MSKAIAVKRFLPETDDLPFQEDSVCALGPEGWYVATGAKDIDAVPLADGDWVIKFDDYTYDVCPHEEMEDLYPGFIGGTD